MGRIVNASTPLCQVWTPQPKWPSSSIGMSVPIVYSSLSLMSLAIVESPFATDKRRLPKSVRATGVFVGTILCSTLKDVWQVAGSKLPAVICRGPNIVACPALAAAIPGQGSTSLGGSPEVVEVDMLCESDEPLWLVELSQ